MGPRGLCRPLDEKQGFLEVREGPKEGFWETMAWDALQNLSFQVAASHRPSSGAPDPVEGGGGARPPFKGTCRSEPRAPMQLVSGALGSLGFRGLGV